MGEKLVIGPINKGLRKDVEAFNIDNDSFPTLQNAYQWRGRIKRKRGTSFINRLSRYLGTTDAGGNLVVTILPIPISVGISSFVIDTDIFTDPGGASPVNLITNSSGTGVLDRATGVLTITGSVPLSCVIYYPTLPVMGLEDLILLSADFPNNMSFDTRYSYEINTLFPFDVHDVSFYKNPAADPIALPGYVPKAIWTPTSWNGQDYQQFWTVNYQGALWATNGITVPFTTTNIGMQFTTITNLSVSVAAKPSQVLFAVTTSDLSIGDFVFINEIRGTIGAKLNFQTGYVVGIPAGHILVEFPDLDMTGVFTYTVNTGIVQYLTNRSDVTKDNIRWFDGDPTNGNPCPPTFELGKGWVNFMPPLSREDYSIADLPPDQYYLVGARMIVPFKDRLLFLGPVVQSFTDHFADTIPGPETINDPIYLQDTVIYSQNGTPFYTASFDGDPSLSTTIFHPILVPINQTATPNAYWEDQTGFGGFVDAGIDEPINTVSTISDVLIIGFRASQTRLVYSGSDVVPFNFYIINSELGSSSVFSAINMDKGVLTRGSRGYTITSQVETSRIDLEIPNQVFEIDLLNNGKERVTAARDFINEWIYFTYPSNTITWKFPTETLQYNYRDNSYATFFETYTTYGLFRKKSGFTWATIGSVFGTWKRWDVPWNAGSSSPENPKVIAGNQQGFVVSRDDGTNESVSLYIANIDNASIVTSRAHSLNNNDYIIISGALGTIDQQVNNRIFSVSKATTNTFELNPTIQGTVGTYLGGGLITRLYVPYIQTKEFPVAWDMARKTRLGPQQYLLTKTEDSQITLLIFLSQDDEFPYNVGPINPQANVTNESLVYSTVLYTCPESTNIGLTSANSNLNTPTAVTQKQIWHRMNTSLIGDTVQIGFTMSDAQMRSLTPSSDSFAITAASQTDPCVIDCTGEFETGQIILIENVVGMVELNGNYYYVLSSTPTDVTIGVDATGFTAYISGGTATAVQPVNQIAEVELHAMILDVQPSQLLV